MNVEFEEGLFLVAASRFHGERTPQAIVHLLRGRKNNQVIADAALFGTSMLYGVMQGISADEVRNRLNTLIERGWIEVHPGVKEGVCCSMVGKEELQKRERTFHYEACLNAITSVHEKVRAVRFWKKLSLFVQTASYLAEGETLFYPVIEQRELQQEVKRVLLDNPDRRMLVSQVKQEIARWMEERNDEERQLILRRLSGKARAGLTYRQLADALHTAEGAVTMHIIRLAAEQLVCMESSSYPLLMKLADKRAGEAGLTRTAQQTRSLLNKGYSFEQVVHRRGLKPGTIEDHLVEIAIADPDFDIQRFVSYKKIKRIQAVMREKGLKKISEIRREVGDEYSFLEIRLASVRALQGGGRL
ncbi:helix-turn-helix domain-containing protein [Aneurinibacillus aneurinilyticus]|uniref:helix-turn-helix domain-containing protein n=1 Tax=Aneurinibacillus aneurinilyticus TaxID=1391 RepID=UPI003526528B